MTSITSNGSILDINTIVSQLMQVEQQPIKKLALQQAQQQANISALANIQGAIASFQDAAKALGDLKTFAAIKAGSSNSAYATVTASNNADVGNINLKISQLATGQYLTSRSYASPGVAMQKPSVPPDPAKDPVSVKMTLTFGAVDDGSFTANTSKSPKTLTLTPDANGQITLASVRDAINKDNTLGVTASIIKDGENSHRLVISSSETGASNGFKINFTGVNKDGETVATTLSQLDFDPSTYKAPAAGSVSTDKQYDNYTIVDGAFAKDAKAVVNGLNITSSSNVLTDVVPGLTISLLKETDATTSSVKLSVSKDSTNVKTALDNFIKSYNSLNSLMTSATAYDSKTKQAGALQGDASIISAQLQIRRLVSGVYGGSETSIHSLSDLGVKVAKDGSLSLDSSKLDKAISGNFQDVVSFFGAVNALPGGSLKPTADSFSGKLATGLDGLLGTRGTLTNRMNWMNGRMDSMKSESDKMTAKLDETEQRYRLQYATLDSLLAKMKSTSDRLAQQLATLPKNDGSK